MPATAATTATRATTRSSARKKHQNASEDNETTATTRTRSTTLVVPLEREAIEEEEDEDCAMSPLRSMQNLEDVTLTFTTTTATKSGGGKGKKATAMRTPKTRSTKKKKSKKTTEEESDKVFEEPPFSPLMRLDSNLDKGGGREEEEFEKEDEYEAGTTMPQSTHKRWVDDDRSPIVTRGGYGGGVSDGTRDGEDENEGFKLDFLDPAVAALEEEEEDVEEEEEEAALKEETYYENVDATEEILARVNARNLTWHKQPERAKFYGGVVEFGQQQSQMMGTLSASTPGFRLATADGAAHRGIPPTPLANTAVPWPNEHTNEGMDTEAFLNGIASFRGGGGNNDNVSRGEGPLPRTPIFQHQRTPIGGGGGVGNIRTNLYVPPHQSRDEMFGNPNEREKQPPSSDEKLSAELRRTKTEILDCQDRRKRLRDTLVALREKEEKLYAKAAEMQRELLRRDPSRSLELGGASIFDAIPPLGDDVVREEKAEVKKERDVAAAATGVARDEEDAEEAPTTSTKNSEKDAEQEHDVKQNQLEEDRRSEEATASTSARNFTSKMSQTYDVHRNVVSMQFLDPSSWLDGQTSLLAASADDVIRLYASDSRKPFALIRTEKGLSCVGTTLNDRVAYCATKFGGVSQIDLATGEKIGTVVQNFEQLRVNKSIDCMATSSSSSTGTDDNILVCAGEGSAIRVWDARCANFGAAPLTFHAPGARNVSSVALAAGGSGHTTLLASAPTSGLFAFDLRVNSSSSSPGVRGGGGGQISRLSVPNFEKQPRWVNAKFCAANEIFAIACDGNAATFEASGEFKATSAFAGVSAPFQMASPASSSPLFSSSRHHHHHHHQSFVKTGGILEVSSDGEHVLVSTGDIGSGVQCFNTSTGAVVASWNPASVDENARNPLSCACWGHAGAARNQPFGQDAFAVADATGSIKVFGVHA